MRMGSKSSNVNRPDRPHVGSRVSMDPTDAESTVQTVLSGSATVIAKTQSGAAEIKRVESIAKHNAIKAKTQAMNQLRAFLVNAPQDVREQL